MIDISTYTNKIANERMVNAVRKAVYDAIEKIVEESGVSITAEFTEAEHHIISELYGPDIRLAILSCIGFLLNRSFVEESEVAEDLNALATQRYGRALREPIIRLLLLIARRIQLAYIEFDLLSGSQVLYHAHVDPETGAISMAGDNSGYLTTIYGCRIPPHYDDYMMMPMFGFNTSPVTYGEFKYAGYKSNDEYGYPVLSSDWMPADASHDETIPATNEEMYYVFMFRKSSSEEAISTSDLAVAEVYFTI